MEKDKDIIIVITDDSIETENTIPHHSDSLTEDTIYTPDIKEDTCTEEAEELPFDDSTEPGTAYDVIDDIDSEEDNNGDTASVYQKVSGYLKSLTHDLTRQFIRISVIISAAIVICTSAAAYFIPKSESAVSGGLERLMRKDSAYLEAKNNYDAAIAEQNNVTKELDEKKNALEEFRKSQNSIDKISKLNAELEQTRDKLKKDAEDKQKELDTLTSIQEKPASRTATLSSGYYTVGEDIAEGTYTVAGTGSIAIANSGRSIANKPLGAEGESFTLKAGDHVQIEGNARFVTQ